MLYAKVAKNKTQEAIFEPFSAVVHKFGALLLVISNFAFEHVLIHQFMEQLHLKIRNLFFVGFLFTIK